MLVCELYKKIAACPTYFPATCFWFTVVFLRFIQIALWSCTSFSQLFMNSFNKQWVGPCNILLGEYNTICLFSFLLMNVWVSFFLPFFLFSFLPFLPFLPPSFHLSLPPFAFINMLLGIFFLHVFWHTCARISQEHWLSNWD